MMVSYCIPHIFNKFTSASPSAFALLIVEQCRMVQYYKVEYLLQPTQGLGSNIQIIFSKQRSPRYGFCVQHGNLF